MAVDTYTFELSPAYTGLSDVGYTVLVASTGATYAARSTSGVYEVATPSGIYAANVDVPTDQTYLVVFDSGATIDPVVKGVTVVRQPLAQAGGSVASAAATTGFRGNSGMSSVDNFYYGSEFTFTSGTLKGITRKCTGYVGSTRAVSFSNALRAAPSVNDSFSISGGNG